MAENTDPTVVAEDTAIEDDGLYRYTDSEGHKRATANGSREHLEQLKVLAAQEKAERAEKERAEAEPEALAAASAEAEVKAPADKKSDNGGQVVTAPATENLGVAPAKVTKAPGVKVDPKA